MAIESNVTFVRVYLHEADRGRRHTLMRDILAALKDHHDVHGVIVFRGIAGVGEGGEVLAEDLLRLTVDLPLVVEFYVEPSAAEGAITTLNGLVSGHAIVAWPARLIQPPA